MNARHATLLLLLLGATPGPLRARLNTVEPWAPGFDTNLPTRRWNHDVNVRVGRGARGTDLTELSYALSLPAGDNWEMGGQWGYTSLDGQSAQSDSGINDLTLAAKYRWPATAVPKPAAAVAEFGLSLPTGDGDKGLGAGGFGFLAGGGFSYPVASVTGYARGEIGVYTEGSGTRRGRTLSFTVGGERRIDAEWTATMDLRLVDHGRDKINGVRSLDKSSEAYLVPGGFWSPPNAPLALQGALLLGLTRDAYDFGLLVGARF